MTGNSLRGRLAVVLIAAVIVVAVVALQPSRAWWGLISGEPFVKGYPASYWDRELSRGPAARSTAVEQLQVARDEAIPVLRSLLRHSTESEVRWTAADMLSSLEAAAHEASEDLLAATNDPDPHVRAVAIAAVPLVETPADVAVPVLTPFLQSEHSVVASRALSRYRGEAAPALKDLLAVLQDESLDSETRWNAARTLGKLGPEGIDALPVLIEYCEHPEDTIREHSAEAIGDIGPLAVDGIPALVGCLDDPATRVRRDAVRSLGYIGEPARETVPHIKPLLDDPEEIVRIAAANALKAIAPEELPEPSAPEPSANESPAAEEPAKNEEATEEQPASADAADSSES